MHDDLVELLIASAGRHADRIAVRAGNATLTYGELARRSLAGAAALVARGVSPGGRVGIAMRRTIDLPCAILATLAAGAAYVPIDPQFPTSRVERMLEHANVAMLVTDDSGAPLPAVPCPRIGWHALVAGQDIPGPPVPADPERTAYLMYTSGSTGTPKGVEVTMANLVNFLKAMHELLQPSPEDIMVSATTISFDIFGLELFVPLLGGATLILAAEDIAHYWSLSDFLERTRPTLFQATPTMWQKLLEVGGRNRSLRLALCGGEALGRRLADDLLAALGPTARLLNMYGPTETTIWSSIAAVAGDGRPVDIGIPIRETDFLLVDADGAEVAGPGTGELLIGGAGVAKGYFRAPDVTASRFVTRQSGRTLSRYYRTGDLVSRTQDGRLLYVGRQDSQVKLHGYRIELGEIEKAIETHSAVRRAVVVCLDEADRGRKELVALVEATTAFDRDVLRNHLAASLPRYMLPHRVEVLAALPETANHKVDRQAAADLARTRHPTAV